MSKMPSFKITHNDRTLGYVTAVSYAKAHAKAIRLYGEFIETHLAANSKPRPSDRLPANADYQAKFNRRYPTDGFEARRAAMLEEFKAR